MCGLGSLKRRSQTCFRPQASVFYTEEERGLRRGTEKGSGTNATAPLRTPPCCWNWAYTVNSATFLERYRINAPHAKRRAVFSMALGGPRSSSVLKDHLLAKSRTPFGYSRAPGAVLRQRMPCKQHRAVHQPLILPGCSSPAKQRHRSQGSISHFDQFPLFYRHGWACSNHPPPAGRRGWPDKTGDDGPGNVGSSKMRTGDRTVRDL